MNEENIVKTYSFKEGKVFVCSNSFVSTEEERKKTIQKIQLCANRILDNILQEKTSKNKKGIE